MSTVDLQRFFVEAFESNDALDLFFAHFAPELRSSLPGLNVERQTYAFRAIDLMRARGYIDPELFTALVKQFPRRASDVAELAAKLLGKAKADAIFGKTAEPERAKPPAAEKLRILVLAANPKDLDELALGKEAGLIDDALGDTSVRDRVRIDVLWAVTVDLVASALDKYKPHVIHYAGHGNETGEPLLLDANQESKAVPLSALARLFRETRSIQCIVFNACFSARVTQELAFEVPVVVGMRDEVSDSTALTFSKRFYGSIGAHKSVRSAFNTARAVIEAMGLHEEHLLQMNAAPDVETDKLVLIPA